MLSTYYDGFLLIAVMGAVLSIAYLVIKYLVDKIGSSG